MTDVWTALRTRTRATGALPLVTYVDPAAGERVELSAASIANAASKIANALRDDFALEPGAVVGLHLPVHWQRAAWCAGVWTAGCAVAPAAIDVDLVVAGPQEAAALGDVGEIAVVSLHPFGLPTDSPLPRNGVDVTLAVRAQPDSYLHEPPTPTDSAWRADGRSLTQSALLDVAAELARGWGLLPGGHLLADDGVQGEPAWLAALAVPLSCSAATVLVRGNGSALHSQERITATAR